MNTETPKTVTVWDPIVRIGHWVIVAGFFTAYFTGEEVLNVHVWAGYAVAAAVIIRVVWGIVGTRNARFASFVKGPGAVVADIKGLFTRKGKRHLGHNPAGSAMIIALLIALTGTAVSGMALYAVEDGRGPLAGVMASPPPAQTAQPAQTETRSSDEEEENGQAYKNAVEGTGEWLEAVHSALTYLTLGLITLHILGVLASSLAHRENLVLAMFTGRKKSTE